MSTTFSCPYLEQGLMLSPTSEVRPCCRFDTSKYDLKGFLWQGETSLRDFYQSSVFNKLREDAKAGIKIAGCHRCYREEELGIQSMRQKEFPSSSPSATHEELLVIELGVGRICNLKCRSCDPYFSTKWESDAQVAQKPLPNTAYDVDLQKISMDTFRAAEKLKITGGEPFYHSYFITFLENLVEHGHAKHIDLEIFSNATHSPSEKMIQILKHFRQVEISLSIDAYGLKNTYIRHPSRWSDIENAVLTWKKRQEETQHFKINFATTVSILNILDLFELFRWISKNFTKPEANILLQVVQDPQHLNIVYWPQEIRRDLYSLFCLQRDIFFKDFPNAKSLKRRLKKIEKMLCSEIEQPSRLDYFWKETQSLDTLRKEDFKSTFPDTYQVLSQSLNK